MVTPTTEKPHEESAPVGWRLDGEFETTESSIVLTVTGQLHTLEAVMLRPGDMDGDGSVGLVDFSTFSVCFGGPNNTTPPAACTLEDFAACDLDDDGDVDLSDFNTFAVNFTGPGG